MIKQVVTLILGFMFCSLLQAGHPRAEQKILETDVCVYGGTPGGISAALAAVRRGRKVIMVTPHRHVGGMHASGLRITGDCHYPLDKGGALPGN